MLDNNLMVRMFYIKLFIYLIIPCTLFAQDDLSGKGIFCYMEIESVGRAIGIEFSTNTQAIIYLEENTEPKKEIYVKYKTSAEQVFLKNTSGYYNFEIDRKTLFVVGSMGIWDGNHCMIVDPKELGNLFIDKFSKFKQGNIL